MTKHAEYFDRLPWDKINALREIMGGEMGWKNKFPRLSKSDKLKVGKITFGCDVKNVKMEFEENVSSGFDTPIIIAEFE